MTHEMRFAFCGQKLVDAFEEATTENSKAYQCASCATRHPVHLIRGEHKRYYKKAWFRHHAIPSGVQQSGRGGGGESEIHVQAKFLLQKHVGRYFFCVSSCPQCSANTFHHTHTEHTVIVEDRDPAAAYIYDAMLYNASGTPITVMEIWNTHQTSSEKVLHIRGRALNFVEFDAAAVVDAFSSPLDEQIRLQNKTIFKNVCTACVQREADERKREQDAKREMLLPLWTMLSCTGQYAYEVDARLMAVVHDMEQSVLQENLWQWAHFGEGVRALDRLHEARRMQRKRKRTWELFAGTSAKRLPVEYNRLHDMYRTIAMEKYWNSAQYQEGLRAYERLQLSIKRKYQIDAFADAHAKDMAREDAVLQRHTYVPGHMRKCAECRRWIRDTMCHAVDTSPWCRERMSDPTVDLCTDCSIACACCLRQHSLKHALRYGLCWHCNQPPPRSFHP